MRNSAIIPACLVGITALACTPSGEPPAPPPAAADLADGSLSATLNGFEIHYEVHGQGPVLMVVPNSWGLSLAGLRNLFAPLEARLTLVYFDPRGMGGSAPVVEDADMGMAAVRSDFQALREHLGLRKASAIGWSNGAMNLILLAAERPETIENAIFVHGAASFTPEDAQAMAQRYPELMARWAAFQQEVAADPGLTAADKTARMRELWLGDYFPTMTGDPAAAGPMMERLFGGAQFSFAHADHANRESPTFDARDRLPMITARSLVVAGAHDMMPPEKVRELADGIAGAEFVVFERSGHFAPAEETEAFRAKVWGFLGVE